MTRIDPRTLAPGQRIFARVEVDRRSGWSTTGYAMVARSAAGGTSLVTSTSHVVDVEATDLVVTLVSDRSPYAAPWEPDPLPVHLPTAFGSRITATVSTPAGPVRMELVRVHHDPVPSPWVAPSGVPYGSNELADVEVLHDPDASQPTAEAATSEPVELPTGLGAVVLAECGQWYGAAVRAHIGVEEEWVFTSTHHSNGTRSYYRVLCSNTDLTNVTVLQRGVEVELP